jgi:acyl CoA:acetate/3-ketoacid CoA transferase beta subunit
VKVVITEHAVFHLTDGELALAELLDGATEETVAAETSARYRVELG